MGMQRGARSGLPLPSSVKRSAQRCSETHYLRITLSRNLAIAESVEPTRWYLVLLAGSMRPRADRILKAGFLHRCEMPKQCRAGD